MCDVNDPQIINCYMKSLTLFLGLLFSIVTHCQQNNKNLISISHTSGGDASSPEGSIAYSVGQVFYTSMNDSNTSVLAGVQQTLPQISQINILESGNPENNLIVLAYPNPMTDYLTIDIGGFNKQNFSYQIFDIKGTLLENKKLKNSKNQILIYNLQTATYFITVAENGSPIKTFKIIKS